MKNILNYFFATLFLLSTKAMAHEGGHYANGKDMVLNTWKLQSGELIQGNFSFAKDDKIFLEQEGGQIKSIYINDLSVQDQKLAKFKIAQYAQLNDAYLNTSQDTSYPLSNFLPLCIIGLLLWLIYTFNKELIQVYILNSKIGSAAFSIFFIFKSLESNALSSAQLFPVLNLSNVALSALVAWLIFKEKISILNFAGIILAVISILLISF